MTGRAFLLGAAALACTGCLHKVEYRPLVSRGETPDVLVIQDVRVFPATSADLVLEHQDVVARNGRLESISGTGAALPEGARVIDGRGKTVLPGLVDMHAHTTFTATPPWFKTLPNVAHNLQAHLYAGVTTVHDTGGRLQDVLAVRKDCATGAALGPRVRIAGPILTARGGYPVSYLERLFPWPLRNIIASRVTIQVADADEGKRAVRTLHAAGVDMIKVVVAQTPDGAPRLDGATLEAIVDTAHRRGLKVIAHVDTSENARIAARAGVDALVHGVHSSPLTPEEAREIKTSAPGAIVVAPTLITFERLDQLANQERFEATPMEKETEPAVLLGQFSREKAGGFTLHPDLASWAKHLAVNREDRLVGSVKRLHEAGVPILVGTDGNGSIASFPGSMQEEMRLLHMAGLSNGEVLLGATSLPARWMDSGAAFGTLEAGKTADLLLVDGNPLEDLEAMNHIALVVQGGTLLVRHAPPE